MGRPRKRIYFETHPGEPKKKKNQNPSVVSYHEETHFSWNCEACDNNYYNSPQLGYVRFPTDSDREQAWMESLELQKYCTISAKKHHSYKRPRYASVCEFHFDPSSSVAWQVPTIMHQTQIPRPKVLEIIGVSNNSESEMEIIKKDPIYEITKRLENITLDEAKEILSSMAKAMDEQKKEIESLKALTDADDGLTIDSFKDNLMIRRCLGKNPKK